MQHRISGLWVVTPQIANKKYLFHKLVIFRPFWGLPCSLSQGVLAWNPFLSPNIRLNSLFYGPWEYLGGLITVFFFEGCDIVMTPLCPPPPLYDNSKNQIQKYIQAVPLTSKSYHNFNALPNSSSHVWQNQSFRKENLIASFAF